MISRGGNYQLWVCLCSSGRHTAELGRRGLLLLGRVASLLHPEVQSRGRRQGALCPPLSCTAHGWVPVSSVCGRGVRCLNLVNTNKLTGLAALTVSCKQHIATRMLPGSSFHKSNACIWKQPKNTPPTSLSFPFLDTLSLVELYLVRYRQKLLLKFQRWIY